jgi:leader peptidase (prepilin peptidase)/N-methyltransferase
MNIVGVKKARNGSIVGAARVVVSGPMFWPASIVVAVAGAAVAASFVIAPNLQGVLGAALAIITILIAFFDWRSFIIPNWLNAAGLCLGLVHAAIFAPGTIIWAVATAIVRALVTVSVFVALRVLYAALRGRQGLGLGDVKLAAVAAVWLDWSLLPIAIELAAVTALCGYALRHLFSGRRMLAQSRVPFGFFFAPAIWVCWICQNAIVIKLLGG